MTLKHRAGLIFLVFFTSFFVSFNAISVTPLPIVETILQKGFSEKIDLLEQTTDALMSEYQSKKNISSLVFYSYGMLKMANKIGQMNDFVRASEYAKTGFFYLDEAVDLYADDVRVRYLRARMDAYLPAVLGRCAVTLKDTEILLNTKSDYDTNILGNIKYMRYRAFYNCKAFQQAEELLLKIKVENSGMGLLSLDINTTPEWDINEVTQVIVPLIKGE